MNHKVLSIGSSLFFTFLCLIFSNQLDAQEKCLNISIAEIEINYLGANNEFLSFEVKIPQSLANKLV